MNGPYDFTSNEIDSEVTLGKIGNYALGKMNEGTFIVQYVGRSDTDLNSELKQNLDPKYPKFKFSYTTTIKQAFEKECRNYHDFGGKEQLGNKIHPDRPNAMTTLKCPVANCTELSGAP
jgi:hypothetical protein